MHIWHQLLNLEQIFHIFFLKRKIIHFSFHIGRNRSEISSQISNNENIKINRVNPTSKTASQCRTIAQDVSLSRRERRTIIRMFSILGSLFMCNLPALLLFTHASYYDVGYLTASYFAPWTRTVMFLNTIINPVLYCYRNEHFHKRRSLHRSRRSLHFRRRQTTLNSAFSSSCILETMSI